MPLQDAAVGCFPKAAGGVARGESLPKKNGSQNTSSDLTNVPRFRIGKLEVCFGYGSGYDSEIRFFLIRKLRCLGLLLTAMAPPAKRSRTDGFLVCFLLSLISLIRQHSKHVKYMT